MGDISIYSIKNTQTQSVINSNSPYTTNPLIFPPSPKGVPLPVFLSDLFKYESIYQGPEFIADQTIKVFMSLSINIALTKEIQAASAKEQVKTYAILQTLFAKAITEAEKEPAYRPFILSAISRYVKRAEQTNTEWDRIIACLGLSLVKTHAADWQSFIAPEDLQIFLPLLSSLETLPKGISQNGILKSKIFFQRYYSQNLWSVVYINVKNGFSEVRIENKLPQQTTATVARTLDTAIKLIADNYDVKEGSTPIIFRLIPDTPSKEYIALMQWGYEQLQNPKTAAVFVNNINSLIATGSVNMNNTETMKYFKFMLHIGLIEECTYVKKSSTGRSIEITVARAKEDNNLFSADVFAAVQEPRQYGMIVYNGHSGLGQSLLATVENARFSARPFLFANFSCSSQESISWFARMYPNAHILSNTIEAWSEDDLHNFEAIQERFLEKGEAADYKTIAEDVFDDPKNNHVYPRNCIYPNMPLYKARLDLGPSDTPNFYPIKKFNKIPELTYQQLPANQYIDSQLKDITRFVYLVFYYQYFLGKYEKYNDCVLAEGTDSGWFVDQNNMDLIKTTTTIANGLKQCGLAVNYGYALTDDVLLKLAITHETVVKLSKQHAADDTIWQSYILGKTNVPENWQKPIKQVQDEAQDSYKRFDDNMQKLGIPVAMQSVFFAKARGFIEATINVLWEMEKNAGQQLTTQEQRAQLFDTFCKKYAWINKKGEPIISYEEFLALCKQIKLAEVYEGTVYRFIDVLAAKADQLGDTALLGNF